VSHRNTIISSLMFWTRLLPSSQLLFVLWPPPQARNCCIQLHSRRSINRFITPSYYNHQRLHILSAHPKDIEFKTTNNNIIMSAHEKIFASLAKSLLDDIVDSSEPTPERANDILTTLQKECNNKKHPMTIAILENTKIGKMLTKTVKACKRHRRTSDEKEEWDMAISIAEGLLANSKEAADQETKQSASKKKSYRWCCIPKGWPTIIRLGIQNTSRESKEGNVQGSTGLASRTHCH